MFFQLLIIDEFTVHMPDCTVHTGAGLKKKKKEKRKKNQESARRRRGKRKTRFPIAPKIYYYLDDQPMIGKPFQLEWMKITSTTECT